MADAKKPDIWMPLYVADYLADTAYLTTEHHGAYLLMLMAYWRNGPIPDNDRIISSITRQSDDAWSITRAVLEPFFQVSDGYWVHKRVEQEYDRAKKNRAASHDRAVKAAAARWGKAENAKGMLGALPEDMLEQCPSPSPSPSPSPTQSKSKDLHVPNGTCSSSPAAGEDHRQSKVDNVPKAEAVPYQAIIDLYHKMLCPPMQRCLVLSDKRKSHMRQRWNGGLGSLDEWTAYFGFIAKSDFLMGRAASSNGSKPFIADLDWVINATNYVKIAERKYHQ